MLSKWLEDGTGMCEVYSAGRKSLFTYRGECLAVAVALEQSKFYTLGCPRLYVATDHKPLVGILCDRALDTIANPTIVSIKERTL